MERSGSQKASLVLSIITIVVAILGLIALGMTIAGGALLGSLIGGALIFWIANNIKKQAGK